MLRGKRPRSRTQICSCHRAGVGLADSTGLAGWLAPIREEVPVLMQKQVKLTGLLGRYVQGLCYGDVCVCERERVRERERRERERSGQASGSRSSRGSDTLQCMSCLSTF